MCEYTIPLSCQAVRKRDMWLILMRVSTRTALSSDMSCPERKTGYLLAPAFHGGYEAHNLQAAVETTVRQVKHPFPGSKLPVRGCFKVSCMMVGSAIMTNVRRISRYLDLKTEQEMVQKQGNKGQKCPENSPLYSFLLNTKFNLSLFVIKIYAISPFRLVNSCLLQ